jgi:hypothetical protein
MKQLYPRIACNAFFSSLVKAVLTVLVVTTAIDTATAQSVTTPELAFKNATLISGTAGQDGAIYRFPAVNNGVDALVKITRRSSALVKLVNIDLGNTGHDKAFQPQVGYGNGSTNSSADWWMEFQVSFVQANTMTTTTVNNFNVTALDIDGNGDRMSEYVSFYNQRSYTVENNSALRVTSLLDLLLGLLLPTSGKRFDGVRNDYSGVDTSVTSVMTTNNYQNSNTMTLRTGGKTTGATDDINDRMYSFWFKGFTYQAPAVSFLPVTLINWNATYANSNVSLKWSTTIEKNASHFMVERSTDGVDYTDAAMIVAAGNSEITRNYSFTDKIPAGNTGVIYYRLKMVDMDGRTKTSDIRIVRIGKSNETVKVVAYPNPVVTDVRITIPQAWQDKKVDYQLVNTNGQTIKSFTIQHASQTEVVSMAQVPAGMYIMKVTNGNAVSTQAIVKSKD